TGEVSPRDGFTDDDHGLRSRVVVVVEGAATDDWDAEHLEEVTADELHQDERARFCRGAGLTGEGELSAQEVFAEERRQENRRRRDARDFLQAREDAIAEREELLVVVDSRAVEGIPQNREMLALVSAVFARQSIETAHEQRGAAEQQRGESDLRCDQDVACR